MTDSLTFVLCMENNAIRGQALLLCESIRRWSGRHRSAPVIAVAPRAGLGVDADTRRRLDDLHVEYVEEPLNRLCPEYGSANRVLAAAWAESRARSRWIVVLDSDTLLLDELALPVDADVGVRPVDAKGSATAGPGDRFEPYWASLAQLGGVPLDRLPYLETTICHSRIRASYNGGLVVSRRECGILSAWGDLFSRSVAQGLRPWRGSGLDVRASTGLVGGRAGEYWGSNQAALAIAMWSRTSRVHVYPDSYNIPLHLLTDADQPRLRWRAAPPVHVHYHWLFTKEALEALRNPKGPADAQGATVTAGLDALRDLGVSEDRLEWLTSRVPV